MSFNWFQEKSVSIMGYIFIYSYYVIKYTIFLNRANSEKDNFCSACKINISGQIPFST
jgi:hypothetical protein